MKRLFIAFIVSLICIFIIWWSIFHLEVALDTISNSIFVVGLFMFFIGLLIITDSTKIFLIVGYSFKSMVKGRKFKNKSYYDYMKEREREKMTPYIIQIFMLGIGYIIISLILAYYTLYNG